MTGGESNQPSTEAEVSAFLASADAKDEAPPSTPSSTSTDPSADGEPAQSKHKQFETNEDLLPSDEERGFAESNKDAKAVDEEIPWDEIDRPAAEGTKENVESSDQKPADDAVLQGDQEDDVVEKEDETEESPHSGSSPTSPEKVSGKDAREESTLEDGIVNGTSKSSSPSKFYPTDVSDIADETKEAKDAAHDIQKEPTLSEAIMDGPSQNISPSKSEPDVSKNSAKEILESAVNAPKETVATHSAGEENMQTEDSAKETSPSPSEITEKGNTENAGVERQKSIGDDGRGENVHQPVNINETSSGISPSNSDANTGKVAADDSDENTSETVGENTVVSVEKENVLEQVKVDGHSQIESPLKPESSLENPVTSSDNEKNAVRPISSGKSKAGTLEVDTDARNNGDQDDVEETEVTTPPTTGGISFAQAFGGKSLPPRHTPSPPASIPKTPSITSYVDHEDTNTPTSHSALSASRNKKASDLISKYKDTVSHEALPGDSVPIRSSKKEHVFATISPGTARILQKKAETTSVELDSLPNLNSVRAKFEKSSRKSSGSFEFGESYRQKKRYEQLSEKEKEEEAKVTMRGFNEKILTGGKSASGEIDTSNLPKSYTFDMSTNAAIVPNDGICRVDYMNADFRSQVFIVHPTRGMLLLQDKQKTSSKSSRKKSTVPGGKISEHEFLAAAKTSGSAYVQLQIAAKEAAARLVFEITGMDFSQQADRLKPAVLTMEPSMNKERGYQHLRNENKEQFYYFLQVNEDDFEKLKDSQGNDAESTKLTSASSWDPGDDSIKAKLEKPSVDPGDDPLTLKLSSDYGGFQFVQDPVVARKILKKDRNDAHIALSMIMTAAAQEMSGSNPTDATDNEIKEPDAKAAKYPNKSIMDDFLEDDEGKNNGLARTIGTADERKTTEGKSFHDDEKKLHMKSSSDNGEHTASVSCCCSFWF
mmetsp:Transcript_19578/g.45627  ORF Transcript_19578/g.45627 Transcript_19578/m.45627 type:complete len:942 (+) Transcript_19578:176-3001(+)|eukprot:CAMPEP_0197191140 /NCGR_PEP_ID=MMETSP1423-20130617/22847_1 /TAXON_ID=476441 /ORGANISM="Pseudo-nitzschia heimii, Strain UNC1101" /LENGTH=941 /DNA_ID=CAMNT_0042643695 /DNA_START=118 /DNA_END=2943 /DNA_ORIENTATION=+